MIQIKEGYYVDKKGHVYSDRKFMKITKLKLYKDHNGYLRVKLSGKTYKVHRIIAQTYIKNSDNKPCVNHIDGNKANNTVDNLEWCTYSDNTKHAYDTGLKVPYIGIKDHGNNKFYKEWKELIKNGESMRTIGKQYGVSHKTVSRVVKKYNNLKIN
jgi:hypothetical protein